MLNRDEKIVEKIIKPKDDLILKLHKENIELNKELSKQANLFAILSFYIILPYFSALRNGGSLSNQGIKISRIDHHNVD